VGSGGGRRASVKMAYKRHHGAWHRASLEIWSVSPAKIISKRACAARECHASLPHIPPPARCHFLLPSFFAAAFGVKSCVLPLLCTASACSLLSCVPLPLPATRGKRAGSRVTPLRYRRASRRTVASLFRAGATRGEQRAAAAAAPAAPSHNGEAAWISAKIA